MPQPNMGRQERRQRRVARRIKQRRLAATRFTEPISGPRARHIARAEANVAYKPTERQIQGEIRGSARQGKRLGHWYDTFAQEMDQARQQSAAAYQQANVDLQGAMDRANTAAAAVGSGLSQEAAQRQGTTGIEGDPRIAAMRQSAAAQSASFGAALQAPLIAQAANANNFALNQRLYAHREGLDQMMKERQRRRAKQEDLIALRRERGQYQTQKLDELRKGERDYQIQRAATGLDKRKAAFEEREGAFDRRTKNRELGEKAQERREGRRQRHREERRKNREVDIDAAEARRRRREANEQEKSGGLTPGERREVKEGRQSALATARAYVTKYGYPENNAEVEELVGKVAKESEVSPAEAEWAVRRLTKKHRRQEEIRSRREHQGKIPGAGGI